MALVKLRPTPPILIVNISTFTDGSLLNLSTIFPLFSLFFVSPVNVKIFKPGNLYSKNNNVHIFVICVKIKSLFSYEDELKYDFCFIADSNPKLINNSSNAISFPLLFIISSFSVLVLIFLSVLLLLLIVKFNLRLEVVLLL